MGQTKMRCWNLTTLPGYHVIDFVAYIRSHIVLFRDAFGLSHPT